MSTEHVREGYPSLGPSPQRQLPGADINMAELDSVPIVPIPSTAVGMTVRRPTTLTPVIVDERALPRLLELLLLSGGVSVNEIARRLGVIDSSVRQYVKGRRRKPGLKWFVKFAEACGARVVVEYPNDGRNPRK